MTAKANSCRKKNSNLILVLLLLHLGIWIWFLFSYFNLDENSQLRVLSIFLFFLLNSEGGTDFVSLK